MQVISYTDREDQAREVDLGAMLDSSELYPEIDFSGREFSTIARWAGLDTPASIPGEN